MAKIDVHACKIVSISALEKTVLDTCAELESCGYLFEAEQGLALIAPVGDADRIKAHFGTLAFIRDPIVRVTNLPLGIKRLSRRKATTSSGQIDGWENGGKLWGWFLPEQMPERRLSLFQGETLIFETRADIFRPDLFEAGVGDGIAGFACVCPQLDPNGARVTLRNAAGKILGTLLVPGQAKSAAAPPRHKTSGAVLGAGQVPEPAASGHYSVALDGFALDYFVSTGTANRMIVFSPGFLDTHRFPYPYFQRMKWARDFEDTCVFLADPTLLLGNTQIGWFIGDRKTHYLPSVARYIATLAQSRSILPEHITFFGSVRHQRPWNCLA